MTLGIVAQWVAFLLFSLIAVAGALGMATTMSMFRSGILLMASFIGVAGLFILLSADLLGLLQIMMYIGGMLVMILFMVRFAHDPGGAMMAGMDMSPVERLFSLGLQPEDQSQDDGMDHGSMGHGEMDHDEMDHGGMDHEEMAHDGMNHGGMNHGQMDMADMSMTTPVKREAALLAIASGLILVGLLLLRPAWPTVTAVPDPNSAQRIGTLLMEKYMMAFEGAGLLILLGIFGAVWLGRANKHPSAEEREAVIAQEMAPPTPENDELSPLASEEQPPTTVAVPEVHQSEHHHPSQRSH